MAYCMKEFTNILPLDLGTLDRYILNICSEEVVIHISTNEELSMLCRNASYVMEYNRVLGLVQNMHVMKEIFKNVSVAQITARKFSVV